MAFLALIHFDMNYQFLLFDKYISIKIVSTYEHNIELDFWDIFLYQNKI